MSGSSKKLALAVVAAAAVGILALGGPQQAWNKVASYSAQIKSDTSGSIRPASQTGTSGAQTGGPPSAPAVTVSKPLVRTISEWDEYTGRFEPVASVDIRARISGYLNEIHFTDGQKVAKGDLLFTIDPRPFERALDQAKAEYDQARTKADNASLDVDRGKPLVDRKIMSEKVFDDRSNLLREAQSAVRVAEAKVKTAELDLFFTKMTSPIAGRISRTGMTAGGWVSAGSAANATLLTTIVSEDPIHIYFDVNESNWLKYRRILDKAESSAAALLGTPIELALPDEKGFPHSGKIDFVDNRLDSATGTIRGRALVDNKSGLFSSGMFARVRVRGSAPYNAVLIPDAAIGTDQTNKFVLAVSEDGTVSRKIVDPGPIFEGLRVIRTGLAATDTVITKGLQRARPGIKVTAKMEPLRVSSDTTAPTAGPSASSGATGPAPAVVAPPPAAAPPVAKTAPAVPRK